MPTKNPRINVVLEDPVYERVRFLAEREGVSLSTKARDLIKEALEVQEDIYLASFAEGRGASWEEKTALSHEEVWS
jgi:predicted DNA-binding protein